MEEHFGQAWGFLREHSAEVAAIIGSISSALCTTNSTWREKLLASVLGIPAAIYGGPMLYAILPQLGEQLSGYFMGFFGFNICKAGLKILRRFEDDADFWVLLKELVIRLYDRYIPAKDAPKGEKE